jgi:hypothetical protein
MHLFYKADGEIRATETDTALENTLINLPDINEIIVTSISW